MTNSVGPDQTAPIGAVGSGSKLFASIFKWPVMLGNYSQQTTSTDDNFRYIFFLALKGLNQLFFYYFTSPFIRLSLTIVRLRQN